MTRDSAPVPLGKSRGGSKGRVDRRTTQPRFLEPFPKPGKTDTDIRYAEIELQTKKVLAYTEIGKRLINGVALVLIAYLVINGLIELSRGEPEALSQLGVFLVKTHLLEAVFGAFGLFMGVAWKLERVGKKRAVRKMEQFRKQLESSDPYRPSSGLDEDGHTPDE